jgi:hypothetical protein
MNVKGGWSEGGTTGGEGGKERILKREEGQYMLHACVQRQNNETTKCCIKHGEERREIGK